MKLKYMKFKSSMMLLIAALFTVNTFAQTAKPTPKRLAKVDGIAAVVGDQIVLESDVDRDYLMSKQQGMQVEDKCDFLNDIMLDKMLVDRAKQDTLIKVTQDEVTRQLNSQIEGWIAQAGGEKQILDYFGFRTMAEMKNETKYIVEDNIYARNKREMVVKGADATPEEVRMFFEKHQGELPDVKDEVSISHIVTYPEVSQENQQKIIDQLKEIKKEIEEGASFATKAILYSEDPGSASNGGEYKKVSRGKMVKEFDAVAFNLQEGEISDPFKTDFGYHIIKLEKRRGQELDLRHILITLKPTEEEIKKAYNKLDSIRVLINDGKMTFKDAALRFSDDKYTKFNSGNIMNQNSGDDRFEKMALPLPMFTAIATLNEGDISQVFEDDFDNRKALRILKINKFYPEHKINYQDDYYRIQKFAVQDKERTLLMDWVKRQVGDAYIKIGKEYQSCNFPIDWEKKNQK
ncbi:peptidylprolyl isomerase [Empedobacter brevis]|uniref:Peptidylprolyl isomerase n=3 Tax=Empedobacter TaxID=59734 RepID=A0A7H9DS64_9FLAO|nr:peptidylprolyl isomerase [Empedobacter brevis]MDM1134018.1 peptidylprolyl isomerase [Empedobacter sp. R750]MDM1138546.1 peptidylprolyl isomerase [Empedobacter sp. R132-2]QLL58038.1 peptidylprolyl isomerase [Empedobacter falsenii]